MYRAFELLIKESDISFNGNGEVDANKAGYAIKNETEKKFETLLPQIIHDGIIDGTELVKRWFPVIHKDVFLSYSHDDEEIAMTIAGLLKEHFDLDPFIDAAYWQSADGLLRQIDNKYCRHTNGTSYDYDKRNFSTGHVHAMLMSQIVRAINECEIVLLLNTNNSVPNIVKTMGDGDFTLSPWIYDEILLSTVIQKRDWTEYRKKKVTATFEHHDGDLKIAYKLPKGDRSRLTWSDIVDWEDEYSSKRSPIESFDKYGFKLNALNCLYDLRLGQEKLQFLSE